MNGGLHTGVFTQIYGEAASGKTTLGLQFVSVMCRQGYGTVYINSEDTSPFERLEQMTDKNFKQIESMVMILKPRDFVEQGILIEDIDLYMKKDTRLIVVDTLTKHYRLALEDKKTNYSNHRELNRQAGVLKGLAYNRDVAILVLNQVTARMDGVEKVEPVAENIMDYWSDYIIEFKVGRKTGQRIMKRLRPDGDCPEGRFLLSSKGFLAESPTEKK